MGFALWDSDKDLETGLMDEGTLRYLIGKYDKEELIAGYNRAIQQFVLPHNKMETNIHILDCTKLCVNLKNKNYEGSGVISDNEGKKRGYKLSTLRGIYEDSGIIEEIRLGAINEHDLELSREMLETSNALKEGDILINDRGFLSRDMLNLLKNKRKVDVYIPVRRNMEIYEQAVSIATSQNDWKNHPNKKRTTQKIALVKELGAFWCSDNPKEDTDVNACVVKDEKTGEFFVFVTTNLTMTARQIIQIYELRPEIEEDYRQIKDFWKIEDFKSTKLPVICFHIVMTLFGYLFFQIYKTTESGKKWAKKSLPIVLKKYSENKPKAIIIYVGQYFALFTLLEFVHLYASCNDDVKKCLDVILAKV